MSVLGCSLDNVLEEGEITPLSLSHSQANIRPDNAGTAGFYPADIMQVCEIPSQSCCNPRDPCTSSVDLVKKGILKSSDGSNPTVRAQPELNIISSPPWQQSGLPQNLELHCGL